MPQFDKTIDSDQLSYYVRVFGNDIRAGDFYQFNIDALKSQFNFLDWMIELSNEHNIDVIKNWQFLDASLTIPTGAGMLSSLFRQLGLLRLSSSHETGHDRFVTHIF